MRNQSLYSALESGQGSTCLVGTADSQVAHGASGSEQDEVGLVIAVVARRQPWLRRRQMVLPALAAACCLGLAWPSRHLAPQAAHTSDQHHLSTKVARPPPAAVAGGGAGRALIIAIANYTDDPDLDRSDVAQAVIHSEEMAKNLNCHFRVLTNSFNSSEDVSSDAIFAFTTGHYAWLGEGDFGVLILVGHGRVGAIFGADSRAIEEVGFEDIFDRSLGAKPKLYFYSHLEGEHDAAAMSKHDSLPQTSASMKNSFHFTYTAPGYVETRPSGNAAFLHACATATRLCLTNGHVSIPDLAEAIKKDFSHLAAHVLENSTGGSDLEAPMPTAYDAPMHNRICGTGKDDAEKPEGVTCQLANVSQNCNDACGLAGRVCDDTTFYDHISMIGAEGMQTCLRGLGLECTGFVHDWGTAEDVPNLRDDGKCFVSASDRPLSSVSCSQGSSRDKRRLCLCGSPTSTASQTATTSPTSTSSQTTTTSPTSTSSQTTTASPAPCPPLGVLIADVGSSDAMLKEHRDVVALQHEGSTNLLIFAVHDGTETMMVGVTICGQEESAPREARYVEGRVALNQMQVSAAWDHGVQAPYASSPSERGYYLARIVKAFGS